jgi:hypothetical protein
MGISITAVLLDQLISNFDQGLNVAILHTSAINGDMPFCGEYF